MKNYRPTTPSRRQTSTVEYRKLLTAKEPEKSLTSGFKRSYGRNNVGRITTRHKGGGHKRLFREIDFKFEKTGIPAKIVSVEYDPNRTGFIGLVVYADGAKRYVLLPQGVKVGDQIVADAEADLKPGNRLPLRKIPVGAYVYNIELKPLGGAKMVRSGGSFAQVLSHDAGYAMVKLPSSEVRRIPEEAWASLGAVSNEEQKLANLGKAGRSRWLGRRPHVRGSAMNPVDHPHGGGEGRQGIGLRRGPKTPWGKLAYGVKTRRAKKYSNVFRVTRRVKKPRK
jgi:large subunit ribosomal protein L2